VIQKDKPLPPELVPIRPEVYRAFLDQVLPAEAISTIRVQINKVRSEWSYFDASIKINVLSNFHDALFASFFPKPSVQKTFARLRFAATFHPGDWSVRFSENFLTHSFDNVFNVWLHESYHGFLHFLSLRLSLEAATDTLHPPSDICEIARKYPLAMNDLVPVTLAKRNLLGSADRGLFGGRGLDSYYLNVEISVETLTELTFKRIFPYAQYKRSYKTADEYIKGRMNGGAPIYCC
jgi:hypothetical protein